MAANESKATFIYDIDMDHFGQSDDRLATTGLASCIGFVVILNDGQNVFVEHRSDIYLPTTINLENIRSCFKNVAKHIFEILPTSNIM
jgi:hypothetical protein